MKVLTLFNLKIFFSRALVTRWIPKASLHKNEDGWGLWLNGFGVIIEARLENS